MSTNYKFLFFALLVIILLGSDYFVAAQIDEAFEDITGDEAYEDYIDTGSASRQVDEAYEDYINTGSASRQFDKDNVGTEGYSCANVSSKYLIAQLIGTVCTKRCSGNERFIEDLGTCKSGVCCLNPLI